MPIKIQGDLPVKEILEKENIFVMDDTRAMHQDIRPFSFQYSASGGRYLYGSGEPSVKKYLHESSEQILSDLF